MTNYSRTTLRELKKRYLNILKKCLLANLMAFSFCLSAGAEESLINRLINNGGIETSQDDIIYLLEDTIISNSGELEKTKLKIDHSLTFNGDYRLIFSDIKSKGVRGGIIQQKKVNTTFNVETIFENNITKNTLDTGVNLTAGVIDSQSGGVILFNKKTIFRNNQLIAISLENSSSANAGVFAPIFHSAINFYDSVDFINNKAVSISKKGSSGSAGGVFYQYNNSRNMYFEGETRFVGNSVNSTAYLGASANGGAIMNHDSKTFFNGITYFINNYANSISETSNASSIGGAIHHVTTASFNNDVFFWGNKVISNSENGKASSRGGAIFIEAGVLNFNGNFEFISNKCIENTIVRNNDIYNVGVINIAGNNESIGLFEGGIAGSTAGIINKSGAGLLVLGDNSENHEYEGAFTQTAGVTIANSERFFSHEKAVNTINGGELKTHGAEIAYKATLGETGTLTHLGTSADTPTEIKGVTFNGTGLNLTLGTYTKAEQEKEIALVGDRLVEYVDDKGTEDTSDDELVSYQATDKLFTIKALENDQKAKFILKENLAGMDGNTLTIDNAELDVAEGLKVAGKVIAKDMTVSKGRAPVSFTEVTVAKEGVLDIGTREMNVDSMTLKDGALLKIGVNSLTEHGKVNGLVTGSETSKIALNLAMNTKNGVYQVFDRDNDLTLQENKLFNIKDLENGAYEVSKKTSENLMQDFDMSASESAVAVALIESESTHKAFNQMQEEMLEALQSEDKGKVQKAKKALKAVGTSEQPSSQSIAASHFNELTRVISQMAMEKEAEIVGHSGGEEAPRAKVYIKGLYDRTKSSMGEGFRARSKGAVLGVQSEVTDTLTLGVGYATSQTTAKEDLRRTEVDTNTGFISAHYQPNAWWMSGLATFSRGEYEEEKQILSSMGKANYDVDSWGAQVMTGYDIKLDNAIITPEVGMRYLSVKQEAYTDTLGTTVSGTRSDYLTALVGVKGTWDMGAIRPTAGVTVGYDIISDDVSALNTLANGASYTVNGEALDRLSTGVSLGVEADLGDRTTLKLEYSGTFRKEYADHSGMLKLEMRF